MLRTGLLGVTLFLAACGADSGSEAAGDADQPVAAGSQSETPAAAQPARNDADGEGEVSSSQPMFASAYTKLDLASCKITHQEEEGESISWQCPGYKGVPLFVHAGDGRFDINAGVDNDSAWSTLMAFNEPGKTVEWRLLNGKPHAIIYRLHDVAPETPKRSVLFVEAIGMDRQPGCVVAQIAGDTPNANEVARRHANDLFENISCKDHETVEVGNAA